MATPFDTSPIVVPDTPDQDPLSDGGRWLSLNGSSLRRINGYISTEPGPVDARMAWIDASFTDASVCFVFNNNPVGYILDLFLRATLDGLNYYRAEIIGPGSNWTLYKRVGGGTETELASAAGANLVAFDRFGFAAIGTAISAWAQAGTGTGTSPLSTGWTEIVSATDSSLTDGYFGIGGASAELEIYQGRGSSLFPIGDGGGGDVAPATPYFDVNIRIA